MKAFRIKTKEGESITINKLDEEAAQFWNKEIETKGYANPTPKFTNPDNLTGIELTKAEINHIRYENMNWFDFIGYEIANPSINGNETGWNKVRIGLLSKLIKPEMFKKTFKQQMEDVAFFNYYLNSYLKLIDHWEEKGYQPIQVIE